MEVALTKHAVLSHTPHHIHVGFSIPL